MSELIYLEYDEEQEAYEDLVFGDVMPSRRWMLADERRHRDIGWELDYEGEELEDELDYEGEELEDELDYEDWQND